MRTTRELHEALYDILSNASAVTALVADRVYPVSAPVNATVPFVVINPMANAPDRSKDADEVDRYRVSIECVADTYTEAVNIAEAVRNTLDRVRRTDLHVDTVFYVTDIAVRDWDTERYIVLSDYEIIMQ